ncbi:hypothetical protein PsAD2_04650 [Pseudovibrio axinellae]|uniref:Uncharacterized protein n=1 Tax=Pseudovibrio axinellae TaxID=989403 RepID=A0A165SWE3_9HYPH|nr:hypothetical protein [Pseudovibrio axinellae]KZL04567.1 hypothetical protein PsAD2_04650 [Pseudovibrio axinellae]SEQ72802.1 hypothetical protein SAMN05421798_10458 [Pseudovibrio axinellae]
MNNIDNDVFDDDCNVPLFLVSEALKLSVLAIISATLLYLMPALDRQMIEAKRSGIPADFITAQITAFDQTASH